MSDQKKQTSRTTLHTSGCLAIGFVIGIVLGMAMDRNMLGMGIGLAIGMALDVIRRARNKEKQD